MNKVRVPTAAHTSWQGDAGVRVAFHRSEVHHGLKLINHASLPRHIATDRCVPFKRKRENK